MPNRYTYNKTKIDTDTKRRYMESTIYPKILPDDNDLYIVSQEGDRLDLLAYKYYGQTNMWWVIAIANNLNNADFYVESGIQLRIPSNVSKISNDLNKLNK